MLYYSKNNLVAKCLITRPFLIARIFMALVAIRMIYITFVFESNKKRDNYLFIGITGLSTALLTLASTIPGSILTPVKVNVFLKVTKS